jgi:hypothetical protein
MVKYTPIIAAFALLVSCSGPDGPTCSSDDDCSSGERCLSSGGLFFGSSYCVPTGEEPINNITVPDAGENVDPGPDCGPDFAEANCDNVDDDGDGVVDEGCSCNFEGSTEGVCGTATRDCRGMCVEPEGYEAEETLCDRLDNDCDGEVDEGSPFQADAVTAGESHTCAIFEANVFCWGRNNRSQLGIGVSEDTALPARVELPAPIDQVSAGAFHTCALSNQTGAIYCWGANDSGQAGVGTGLEPGEDVTEPNRIDPPQMDTPWTRVSASTGYTCGIAGGQVYCWGANDFGQTGNTPSQDIVVDPTPIDAPNGVLFDEVSTGDLHACATSTSDVGYCWGFSEDDRLARMVTGPYGPPDEINVRNDVNFQVDHFSVGFDHACVTATIGVDPVSATGVVCEGSNTFGQLGGTPPPDIVETNAIGPLDSGTHFTCSFASSRGVDCWGKNDFGQLGRPVSPTLGVGRVDGLDVNDSNRVRAVAAGARHACALLTDGLYCWGDNEFGQLGTSVAQPGTTPVQCIVRDDPQTPVVP